VTREDIDRAFIDRIALIAIAGCSSEGAWPTVCQPGLLGGGTTGT
jgi:hypothetical protein